MGIVDGPNLYAYVVQNPWSRFDPDGQFWSAVITAEFAIYDTYQYASGNIGGAEYAGRMALNGAALLADAATGGMGGGVALRTAAIATRAGKVGQAVVKGAIALDKADTLVSAGQALVSAKDAIEEGDYGRAALSVVQVVASKSDVLPGSTSSKAIKEETTKNVEAIVEGRLVTGSSNGFDRRQKEMAENIGIRTVPSKRGNHAEENVLDSTNVEAIGTYKRKPCGPGEHNCNSKLEEAEVEYSEQLEGLAKQVREAGISEPSRNRRTIAVGREPRRKPKAGE